MLRQIKRIDGRKSSLIFKFLVYAILIILVSITFIDYNVFGLVTEYNSDPEEDGDFEDEDNDEIDDEIEKVNEREIKIEIDEEQVEIESRLKNGSSKDEINLVFKISDEPEIYFEYDSEIDSLERELELEIRFISLLEFEDSNGNNILDPVDTIIQEKELETSYNPIQHIIQHDDENHTIHVFNTTSLDGIFSLQFFVPTEFSTINDEIIVPSEIKLDIAIHNFPFSETTSKLALYMNLEAENEFELDDETEDEKEGRSSNEKEVQIVMGGFTAFFSWNEFAFIDGINHSVANSNLSSDDSETQKIYLTYNQGIEIIHDPKIGIEGIINTPIGEIIPNILSALSLPKEEYLLAVVGLTTIMIFSAWVLYRKNLF